MTEKKIKLGYSYWVKNRPLTGKGPKESRYDRCKLQDSLVTISDIKYRQSGKKETRYYVDENIYFSANELTPQRCDKAKCPCH